MIYSLKRPTTKISNKNFWDSYVIVKIKASHKIINELVRGKIQLIDGVLVLQELLIETKIKSMRHISTLSFILILLFSTVYAQDSSNLKSQGLKILNRQLPPTTPTTEPVVIRIRCLGSNLSPDPLLIIDGIVAEKFDLRNINPDNIESISILKGSTATALYGCRAMSGVIIITTKSANARVISVKDMFTGESAS
jgi:TonB-dependent SusC/RagA subfamily outer membrane receptor